MSPDQVWGFTAQSPVVPNRPGYIKGFKVPDHLLGRPPLKSDLGAVPQPCNNNKPAMKNYVLSSVPMGMDTEVDFTLISRKDLLTKKIKPDGRRGIEKTAVAHMTSGTAKREKISFAELGEYFRNLSKNQCLVHGVPCNHGGDDWQEFGIRVRGKERPPKIISRSKRYFIYPENTPHLAMFDHDPKPGQRIYTVNEFLSAIIKAAPSFKNYPTMWTPSTSSCIYDLNKNQLTDEGNGFHLYFPFQGNNLSDFVDTLFKRLWLNGHGYIFITAAGSMLPRSIFDASVFSPERLDFVAGAECIDCLQKLSKPVYRMGMEEIK